MPARPSVDADDPVVADLLDATLDLIAESGGWVDPTVVLRARDGQLSLLATGPEDGPLACIPREAMVRVDAVTWADDDERLIIESVPDDIGDIELQMLYVQSALHNQCGKLPWIAATHPALAPDLPESLIVAARAVVPSFRSGRMTARDVLWANRCFRLPLDQTMPRVLVPIVDLLNHHSFGASGSWDGHDFSVATRRPFDGSECALDYGMGRDAMETAVVYGFADTSAVLAHSAPLHVTVDGVGDLVVDGAGRAPDGSWLPVTAVISRDAIHLSHLTFSGAQPQRTIVELAAATGWDDARCRVAAAEVIDANVEILEPLVASPFDDAAARTLSAAAAHQRHVLRTVRDGI